MCNKSITSLFGAKTAIGVPEEAGIHARDVDSIELMPFYITSKTNLGKSAQYLIIRHELVLLKLMNTIADVGSRFKGVKP